MRATKQVSVAAAACLAAGSLLIANAPPASAATPPSEWVRGPLKQVVLLTFDGQGSARDLLDVLETLERQNAKASFFVSGRWVRYHERKIRMLRRAGHVVGNRGYGTKKFTAMNDEQIRSSISRARERLAAVGVDPGPFLRFPKGARDLRTLRVAGSIGYRSVRWTYRAGGGLANKVAKKVLNHLQWGSIVNLDTWRKSHRRALPAIIDGIRRKGYSLRTLDPLTRTHAVRWDVTLREGSSGSEVSYLHKILRRLTYPVGRGDGHFGYELLQATYAFEKTNKLARDGVVTPADMTRIAMSARPKARKHGKVRNYIDVDISRQVVFEVRKGKVKHTSPISSGNEEYYTVDGQTYKAHTPRGAFKIERKILGERVSRLGTLYDPSYFIGGYAFHGSPSVPTHPASHGCIRLPMYMRRAFFNRNPVGMPVFIHG